MAKWPSDEVTESAQHHPAGLYKVKITKQEDGESKNGQFTIFVNGRILEPKNFKGQPYNIRFMIGMTAETAAKFGLDDEDLEASNEATWLASPQAAKYKGLLAAAGVAPSGDTEEEAEDMKDKVIWVQNNVRDDKYDDPVAFYAEDSAPVGAVISATKSSPLQPKSKPANGKPAAKPAPKPVEAEVVDEGGDDSEWED